MRIARDVHDVVGHSLSVITMQAGVALHVLDRRPDQVAASLEAIRTTSREALAELRTTLEVFRDPESGEPRAPVPGLARLDDLVGALRQAGRSVEVVREGDGPPLPAAVDQAAFRIIQEALTNVVRHAEQATAVVRVARTPGRLVVEVSDDGPASAVPAAGNGIRGHGGAGSGGRRHARRAGSAGRRARGPRRAAGPGGRRRDDLGGAGRRPGPGPDGPAGADRVRGRPDAGRRGRQRSGRGQPGPPDPAGRGADGHPDAGAGRHRGPARR